MSTVSISAIFGENGLIKKAQEAKYYQSNALAMEESEMDKIEEEYANLTASEGNGEVTPPEPEAPEITPDTPVGTEVKAPNTWTSDKVTPISDGSGNAIPLPNGFYYIGGDRNKGLVISDRQGDTLTSSYPNSGNQFVWIPVDSEQDLERSNFGASDVEIGFNQNSSTIKLSNRYGEISIEKLPTISNYDIIFTAPPIGSSYIEPSTNGYSDGNGTQEVADFNTMKAQVLKYGGFYIGRYEAGDKTNGTTLRKKVTIDHEVVVQKGVAPYNYVQWGKDMSDVDSPISYNSGSVTAHGAVYLSKHMYDGKEQAKSIVSTLCYGSQWDAMCRYIGDNNRTTPEKDSLDLTGSVPTDVSKNIYDLAGNCQEWTLEASGSYYRVIRGGIYHNVYPVSYRYYSIPYNTSDDYSFRPSLYIKD